MLASPSSPDGRRATPVTFPGGMGAHGIGKSYRGRLTLHKRIACSWSANCPRKRRLAGKSLTSHHHHLRRGHLREHSPLPPPLLLPSSPLPQRHLLQQQQDRLPPPSAASRLIISASRPRECREGTGEKIALGVSALLKEGVDVIDGDIFHISENKNGEGNGELLLLVSRKVRKLRLLGLGRIRGGVSSALSSAMCCPRTRESRFLIRTKRI